ncbi:MerR family transcriptional regulator [Acidithiobacillus sp. HP-6]|uniref:MerR family transcriptional regulator n=1 Tax=unclassified Acidithiobacillus TaxID=2614800 RepID=UPI0018791D79|nr:MULTISPECIES: MerR family transcriptional regulator [unclassified Acidithiobacillus]MBE7563774.1 MerR family transcriptional regulator [Acidithiobacillus sp. HP-6]MBE7569543.1 MerR family transcriptional regulator [Acidithiobacillus sp. HP-2]
MDISTDETEVPQFPISVVEQETGISKELLRMWERRYAFPVPGRDAAGNRLYSRAQIEQLHRINQLLAAGYRPGAVVGADAQKIDNLVAEIPAQHSAPHEDPAVLAEALNMLASDRPELLRSYMRRQLQQEGLPRFVLQVAAPLLQRVARARMMGEIKPYREGCLQELLMECLYVATSQLPGGETRLRVLLASFPGEGRTLELQMTRALLMGEGVDVLFIGSEPEVDDLIAAAEACHVQVIHLAVSAASVNVQNRQLLHDLQRRMPAGVSLWLGGSGCQELGAAKDESCFVRLQDMLRAIREWV